MPKQQLAQWIYVIKILICAIIITLLSITFNQDQVSPLFLWGSLTAFFTIQPDIDHKVNFSQITGNLIGSGIGVLIWLFISHFSQHPHGITVDYLILILGILLTTMSCILCHHSEYCGIALSGFLIVTLYDVTHNTFEGALWRILCCLLGCGIAYFTDFLVRWSMRFYQKKGIK